MNIGTVVKLKVECLGNKPGTLGVAFNKYGLNGIQIIFENGNYDGFSKDEQETFLEYVRDEETLSSYVFRHVIQTSRDFDAGFFDKAFK